MKKAYYSPEQVTEIATYLDETSDTTLQRKYLALQLSSQGHTNRAIAKMLALHPATVGIYINTYQKEGIAALTPVKQSGRPPFMTEEQGQALYAVIRDKVPHEVGFPGRYNWTAKLAAKWRN